jgi:hypothetical protein
MLAAEAQAKGTNIAQRQLTRPGASSMKDLVHVHVKELICRSAYKLTCLCVHTCVSPRMHHPQKEAVVQGSQQG